MPDLLTRDFLNVELMTVGTWDGQGCPDGGCEFNETTLFDIVTATQEAMSQNMRAPVKLGHGDQKLLEAEGLPAVGWLENVQLMGETIVADIKQVPKRIADIIDAGGWRNRSVELRQRNGKLVLTGLALLGNRLPAIDTLRDIEALYAELNLESPEDPATVIVFADSKDVDPLFEANKVLNNLVETHPAIKPHVDALRRTITGDKQEMELSAIAQKLGLGDDATEESVMAKLDELNKPEPKTEEDPKTDLEHSDDDDTQKTIAELSKQVLELQRKDVESSARLLVEKAIEDGKILPAQREQSLKFAIRDATGFNDFVKSQPKVLEFGERGSSNSSNDDDSDYEPTAVDLEIAKITGVTPDEIKIQKMRDAGVEPSAELIAAAFGKK